MTGAISNLINAIEIPSTITYNGKEYQVTGIKEKAFYNYYRLNDIKMPDSPNFTSIGSQAFANCVQLKYVTIPQYIPTISDQFTGCDKVTNLFVNGVWLTADGKSAMDWSKVFPNINYLNIERLDVVPAGFYTKSKSAIEVKIKSGCTLKSKAFYGISSITVTGSPGTIEKDAVGNEDGTCEADIDLYKTTTIQDEAFCKCKTIIHKTISTTNSQELDLSSCETIGADIFKGCNSSLSDILMIVNGDKVRKHYSDYKKALSSAKITTIRANYGSSDDYTPEANLGTLFTGTKSFIFCGDKVSKYALYGSKSVESVEIYGHEIEANAFANCTNLTSIKAENVYTMTSAFYGCSSLEYASFPQLSELKGANFRNCTKLKTAEIISIEHVNDYEFYNDKNLETIKAPFLDSIGNYAFYNCVKLQSKSLHRVPNYIGNYAFYGCSALTNFYNLFGDETIIIGDYAFAKTNLTTLYVGKNVKSVGVGAFSNLKKVTINSPTLLGQEISILDRIGLRNDGTAQLYLGDLSSKDLYEVKATFNPTTRLKLDLVYIDNSIGNIYSKVFYNIEANNVHIESGADFVCPVKDIQLYCKNVLTVESSRIFLNNNKKIFSANYNLFDIFGKEVKEIDATLASLRNGEISDYAFYVKEGSDSELTTVASSWCKIGKHAFDGNKNLSSFTFISEEVTYINRSIGEYAFRNCNLPFFCNKKEIYVGEYAFQNNPMNVIIISNEKSQVADNAFLGTDPHMVIDMTDGFIVDNNKETVKFITNSEKRAKELRAAPYSIVHACSMKRLSHTAEDVNLDGSLSGDDVQLIYNAMK